MKHVESTCKVYPLNVANLVLLSRLTGESINGSKNIVETISTIQWKDNLESLNEVVNNFMMLGCKLWIVSSKTAAWVKLLVEKS
jgi:hypothetical protein